MKDNFDLKELILTKKKKKNSRAKGNGFERKLCEILNDCFETKDFMRSPGSGAFATTHKLPDHLQIHGDLITPDRFKFTIECKFGYNKENIGYFFSDKSDLSSFIVQAERDSKKATKDFLLVFKQNNRGILCLFLIDKSYDIFNVVKGNLNYLTFTPKETNSSTYCICNIEELLSLSKLINLRSLFFKP